MNVYNCYYYKAYGYGAYEEYDAIIVANSESEALGFALTEFPTTIGAQWQVEKIDTASPGVKNATDRNP